MVTIMPQLSIRLLGAPEIRCAGSPVDIQQNKARALVFYLAATGRAHVRDHIATLFWGESDTASALHSLGSTLYYLRQTLHTYGADEALVLQGGLVSLQPSAVTCDVLRFHGLLAEGTESSLARAVSLYDGLLLEGFTLPDAPEFHRWERNAAAELHPACLDA